MTRSDKIKTLTSLMQGKLRITDIIPETISVWHKPHKTYNGTDRGRAVEYTEEEFSSFCNRQNPKTKIITFKPVAGRQPLADHE